MSKYTVDYFIRKFEAIPAKEWCRGRYTDSSGRHCVLGHLGVTRGHHTDEYRGLRELFTDGCIVLISDDPSGHPRDNILRALRALKKKAA